MPVFWDQQNSCFRPSIHSGGDSFLTMNHAKDPFAQIPSLGGTPGSYYSSFGTKSNHHSQIHGPWEGPLMGYLGLG